MAGPGVGRCVAPSALLAPLPPQQSTSPACAAARGWACTGPRCSGSSKAGTLQRHCQPAETWRRSQRCRSCATWALCWLRAAPSTWRSLPFRCARASREASPLAGQEATACLHARQHGWLELAGRLCEQAAPRRPPPAQPVCPDLALCGGHGLALQLAHLLNSPAQQPGGAGGHCRCLQGAEVGGHICG